MRVSAALLFLVICLPVLSVDSDVSAVAQEKAERTLTNSDVQLMLKAGLSDDIIRAKLQTAPCEFDTSPQALTQLKEAGASDDLLLFLIQGPSPAQTAELKNGNVNEGGINGGTSKGDSAGTLPKVVPADQPSPALKPKTETATAVPKTGGIDERSTGRDVPKQDFEELMFKKVKWVTREGDKSKEHDARLFMTQDGFQVKDKKGNVQYEFAPYDLVYKIIYEKSQHPRWKTAILVSPLALLSKGKKHWLTVNWEQNGERDFFILKMDKDNYREIVSACEVRTGLEVEWIIED